MNIYQRARQFWAVLAYAASMPVIVTYEELGDATGSKPGSEEMNQSLREIEVFCQGCNNIPILTDIINKTPGKLRDRFCDWEPKAQRVVGHHWRKHVEDFEKFLKAREGGK